MERSSRPGRLWQVIAPGERQAMVLMAIAGLVGCTIDTQPQDVSYFVTDQAPAKELTVFAGNFTLYHDDNDTDAAGARVITKHLAKGETVGFEVSADHVPFAVAGNQKVKLTPGHYRWEVTADRGQSDWNKTNTVVIEVVVVVIVIAIAVVTTIITVKQI